MRPIECVPYMLLTQHIELLKPRERLEPFRGCLQVGTPKLSAGPVAAFPGLPAIDEVESSAFDILQPHDAIVKSGWGFVADAVDNLVAAGMIILNYHNFALEPGPQKMVNLLIEPGL